MCNDSSLPLKWYFPFARLSTKDRLPWNKVGQDVIFCLHIFHTTIHTKREGRFSAPPPSLSDENRPRTLNRVKQVPREAEPCRPQILRHIGNDTLVDELPSLIDDDGIFRLKVRVKNGLQCYSFLNVRSLFPAPITLANVAVGVARFFRIHILYTTIRAHAHA